MSLGTQEACLKGQRVKQNAEAKRALSSPYSAVETGVDRRMGIGCSGLEACHFSQRVLFNEGGQKTPPKNS